MWLILVDAFAVAFTLASFFTLTIPFALCADVVAEHGSKDEVLFGRELVQWTCDDKPDGLQTLAPSEVHVQVLLSGRLQQVWNTLAL